MQGTRVTVQVAGQTLNLRGTENEAQIRTIAAYLDESVQSVQDKHPALSTNMCLILASLNITEELLELRKQYEELDKRILELRQLSMPKVPAPPMIKKPAKEPIKHPFEKDPHSSLS